MEISLVVICQIRLKDGLEGIVVLRVVVNFFFFCLCQARLALNVLRLSCLAISFLLILLSLENFMFLFSSSLILRIARSEFSHKRDSRIVDFIRQIEKQTIAPLVDHPKETQFSPLILNNFLLHCYFFDFFLVFVSEASSLSYRHKGTIRSFSVYLFLTQYIPKGQKFIRIH